MPIAWKYSLKYLSDVKQLFEMLSGQKILVGLVFSRVEKDSSHYMIRSKLYSKSLKDFLIFLSNTGQQVHKSFLSAIKANYSNLKGEVTHQELLVYPKKNSFKISKIHGYVLQCFIALKYDFCHENFLQSKGPLV